MGFKGKWVSLIRRAEFSLKRVPGWEVGYSAGDFWVSYLILKTDIEWSQLSFANEFLRKPSVKSK
ncbi:hypothetical protein EHQ55_16170 [Leptospira meyeri]|nr:hypothetical protein EHQ55_16170 [Leptospira meyeri]